MEHNYEDTAIDPHNRKLTFPEEGRVLTGVVKKFEDKKGFGFLYDSDNNEYFVHFSEIEGKGFKSLGSGQHVKFIGKEGPRGLFAEEVRVIQV
jgi:CspA family cold shock protein